ncbi:unnamed protein product [Rotaria sordida]|uniref:UBC core domain-containing protein n=1 Tax=Rotaria sordida TaxID=392033 RepID=A0A815KS64_9BILA|nr:unnamed protein product [Rotaria sordida]CAF1370276.1 unnamed protein product [Rotaria sordida]CAF1397045.1 unnamed protein product [Rotaria sordida]CAF1611313.1 unnamed protein product [Rotaria sordida]CAF3848049.1 unnamed protein product [Rotaria sordida]
MASDTSFPPIVPNRQVRRLQRDLDAAVDNPLPFIREQELLVDDGLNVVTGIMTGPENSPYAGGYFRFVIKFPPEYPFKPPDFFFKTPICHPNVHSETGIAWHDQLYYTWAPNITLSQIFTSMHSLLAQPNYKVPLSDKNLPNKSPEKARLWTQQYA